VFGGADFREAAASAVLAAASEATADAVAAAEAEASAARRANSRRDIAVFRFSSMQLPVFVVLLSVS
jgi:hypothetical protein